MNLRLIYFIAFVVLLSFSCKKKAAEELVICTQIPVNTSANFSTENLYPENARLVAFSFNNPHESLKVLSKELYSACSPDAFYTGETLVFSAQKNEGDTWQIWAINLRSFKVKQITNEPFNCTDPLYLPTGKIVFSGEQTFNSTKGHVLFKCNSNGSGTQQITFHPHTDFASSILLDGRVLYLSQQEIPNKGRIKRMAMRPDGTKAELFNQGLASNTLPGRAWETIDEKIVFTEKDIETKKSKLLLLNYNNPFHSKQIIGASNIDFLSVYPLNENNYLVSAKNKTEIAGLYLYNSKSKKIDLPLLNDKNYHSYEPVINQVKQRARKLPSAVNKHKSTGLFLCQDIHMSQIEAMAATSNDASVTIELAGMDKVWKKVKPKQDGSLYIKVQADTPFQFKVLNENGEIIRGPSEWLWVRPNERRGCVGCHADPEMVPKNYVPLAVKDKPIAVPVNSMRKEEKR